MISINPNLKDDTTQRNVCDIAFEGAIQFPVT